VRVNDIEAALLQDLFYCSGQPGIDLILAHFIRDKLGLVQPPRQRRALQAHDAAALLANFFRQLENPDFGSTKVTCQVYN